MTEQPTPFPHIRDNERVTARLRSLDELSIDIAGIKTPDSMVWRCACGIEVATFDDVMRHSQEVHGMTFQPPPGFQTGGNDRGAALVGAPDAEVK